MPSADSATVRGLAPLPGPSPVLDPALGGVLGSLSLPTMDALATLLSDGLTSWVPGGRPTTPATEFAGAGIGAVVAAPGILGGAQGGGALKDLWVPSAVAIPERVGASSPVDHPTPGSRRGSEPISPSSPTTDRHTDNELGAILGALGLLVLVWSALHSRPVFFSNWAAVTTARPG
jgi:hypothetical protein